MVVKSMWTIYYKNSEYKLGFYTIYMIKDEILINSTCFKVFKQDMFIIYLLSSAYSDEFIMVKS